MTEIRTKDKIFLAVVVPAALIAAYWYCWRSPANRQLAELQSREAQLVDAEDFPMEKRRAELELAEAKAELEAERNAPAPQVEVVAEAGASEAERERQALQIIRESGLAVVASEMPKGNAAPGSGKGGELLMATGLRPAPIRRSYTVDGRYPDVVKALKAFSERKMAVIPDCVQMRAAGRSRWTLEVWL